MSKSFVVLSMYEVHMASASIMVDGVVKAACHEERFSRLKNDVGFPLLAAKYCMKEAGISPSDIDEVAICNHEFNKNGVANIMFKRPATYTIEEWLEENSKYWHPKLVDGKKIDTYFDLMGGLDRVKDHYYDFSSVNFKDRDDIFIKNFNQIRRNTVELLLGIPEDKVVFYPHYKCHHYHAYYSGSFRNDDVVIVHQEGDGGKYNSGVSIPTNKGLKWLGGSNQSDLGRLYQWITLLMGMKPYHHEYKLMGLAPYATEYEVNKTFKEFSEIFQIDNKLLSIVYKNKPSDLYFHFKDLLSGHRFDGIAGALQLLTEETLSLWLKQVLKITKKSISF